MQQLTRFVAAAVLLLAGCGPAPVLAPRAGPAAVHDAGGPLPPAAAARVVDGHLRDAPVGAPLVLGNHAHLLIDGPATHRAMFEAIAAARRHVHLETYIVEADEVGARLAALLERKRAQGVEVRVLYDSVGSRGTPAEYFARLRDAGVAVCEFNPVNPVRAPRGWQLNNRDHRKVLVVDGRIAFTGGINISGVYSAGSFASGRAAPPTEEGWRDTHVVARGPIVGDFQRLFLETWASQRCPPVEQRTAYLPRLAPAGDWPMRLVAADPEQGESEMYAALLAAMTRARERVWLTYGYFVPDPRTVEAITAAAARGVDVRLVLPGVSDFWAPLYAGRSHYERLLGAGVRIFERHDALVHAKTAVIDGVWASVGSTNLDWRSFVHNYEADLIVVAPAFARELERLFARDVARADEIALDQWRQRSALARLREAFARAWAYYL